MLSRQKMLVGVLIIIIVLSGLAVLWAARSPEPESNNMNNNLKLSSPAFINNELIPEKYTCDGSNFNPPLAISGVPANAQSLVLIMADPDAPVVGGWDHWVLYNLPPDTTVLGEGEPPPGIIGRTSSETMNYEGPCPPSGIHRYFFKLYALNGWLDLMPGASKAEVEAAMLGKIINQVELIGRYGQN